MKQKTIFVVYQECESYDLCPTAVEAFETEKAAQTFIENFKNNILSREKFDEIEDTLRLQESKIASKYYNMDTNEPLYPNADKYYDADMEEWEFKDKYRFIENVFGINEEEYERNRQEYCLGKIYYFIEKIQYNYND